MEQTMVTCNYCDKAVELSEAKGWLRISSDTGDLKINNENRGGELCSASSHTHYDLCSDECISKTLISKDSINLHTKDEVRAMLNEMIDVAESGISYVGAANYASRQAEANKKVRVKYNELWEKSGKKDV